MSDLESVEWKGTTVKAYVSDEEPEVIDVSTWGRVQYLEMSCPHNLVIPIESALDPSEIIAHLCLRCDEQLPDWWCP